MDNSISPSRAQPVVSNDASVAPTAVTTAVDSVSTSPKLDGIGRKQEQTLFAQLRRAGSDSLPRAPTGTFKSAVVKKPTTPPSLSNLPAELQQKIIDHLNDFGDQSNANLSLVNRQFHTWVGERALLDNLIREQSRYGIDNPIKAEVFLAHLARAASLSEPLRVIALGSCLSGMENIQATPAQTVQILQTALEALMALQSPQNQTSMGLQLLNILENEYTEFANTVGAACQDSVTADAVEAFFDAFNAQSMCLRDAGFTEVNDAIPMCLYMVQEPERQLDLWHGWLQQPPAPSAENQSTRLIALADTIPDLPREHRIAAFDVMKPHIDNVSESARPRFLSLLSAVIPVADDELQAEMLTWIAASCPARHVAKVLVDMHRDLERYGEATQCLYGLLVCHHVRSTMGF